MSASRLIPEAALVAASPRPLTPKRAAGLAGVTPTSVRRWVKKYGIGYRVAGRVYVDRERLDLFLRGGARG